MALVRTQISLPLDLHRRAKRRAAEEGVSLAELTRRALAREVAQSEQPKGDITAIFGLFRSEGSNVAKYKEQYLDEATRREYERKMGRLSKAELEPSEDA